MRHTLDQGLAADSGVAELGTTKGIQAAWRTEFLPGREVGFLWAPNFAKYNEPENLNSEGSLGDGVQ